MSEGKKVRNDSDLTDPQRDQDRMQPEETIIDLPDVTDIPGQEHIHVPKMKEFIDTTISSDDEEGKRVFDQPDLADAASDVTAQEIEMLERSASNMDPIAEAEWRHALVDDEDNEGIPLNETSNNSGSDLDIPGSEQDDPNEALGSEDEENNSYSLPDS